MTFNLSVDKKSFQSNKLVLLLTQPNIIKKNRLVIWESYLKVSRTGTALLLTSPCESWITAWILWLCSSSPPYSSIIRLIGLQRLFPLSCLRSTKSQSKWIALFDPKTKSCVCEQWLYLHIQIITRNSYAVLPSNHLQDTCRGINTAVKSLFI